ncbi:hypothetical protein Gotur_015387, partial [Gossypium turneri]
VAEKTAFLRPIELKLVPVPWKVVHLETSFLIRMNL